MLTISENISTINSVIHVNRFLLCKSVKNVGINTELRHKILTIKFGMHCISAKLPPHMLTDDHNCEH